MVSNENEKKYIRITHHENSEKDDFGWKMAKEVATFVSRKFLLAYCPKKDGCGRL